MNNKVKPFFIRITDDMTPQMVQDAFDKCHNLGVRASKNDDIENLPDWNYFGVCAKDGTYLSESERGYFDAQEITLDRLDEWLGFDVEQEWKNGDECVWLANNQEFKFVSLHCENKEIAIVWNGANDYRHCKLSDLRKPETPEQKAERERDEILVSEIMSHPVLHDAITHLGDFADAVQLRMSICEDEGSKVYWVRQLERINDIKGFIDKTNYRKDLK